MSSPNGTRVGTLSLEESWKVVDEAATSRSMPSGNLVERLPIQFREAVQLAADSGEAGITRWLSRIAKNDTEAVTLYHEARERAKSLANKPSGRPFSLDLLDTASFFAETYSLEFMIKGLLVKDQPCVFGGPQKSLKTSILIDLAISAASQTPFLGRFTVPKPLSVLLISGESGRATIQANAMEICKARELPFNCIGSIHWGFNLPRLSCAEHIKLLTDAIADKGIDLVLLDPLYLALLSEGVDIDPKDMFQMGPLLADVAASCIGAGATPVLCHHFVKKRDDPFGPPDMGELAYAGIGQFMRQWILTSRRERYEPDSGLHKLHFNYGGSAGHSGELHLDIDTGRIDEELKGRKWNVAFLSPSEGAAVRQEQAKAERQRLAAEKEAAEQEKRNRKVEANAEKLFAALATLGGVQTRTNLRRTAGLTTDTIDPAIHLLISSNRIRLSTTSVKTGTAERVVEGYELVALAGIQASLGLTGDNRG